MYILFYGLPIVATIFFIFSIRLILAATRLVNSIMDNGFDINICRTEKKQAPVYDRYSDVSTSNPNGEIK